MEKSEMMVISDVRSVRKVVIDIFEREHYITSIEGTNEVIAIKGDLERFKKRKIWSPYSEVNIQITPMGPNLVNLTLEFKEIEGVHVPIWYWFIMEYAFNSRVNIIKNYFKNKGMLT